MIPHDEQSIVIFILVLSRISGLFIAAPFISSRSIPMQVKALLAMILSALLVPFISVAPGTGFDWMLVPRVCIEVLIGVTIGYMFLSVFLAAQAAGQMIDFQLGFALAQAIDPAMGGYSTPIARFYASLAVVLFLVSGGQYLLLQVAIGSFTIIPAGTVSLPTAFIPTAIKVLCGVMLLAVKIGAPVIAALFVADVVFGIVGRAVPQLNIFVIGFPVKTLLGLVAVLVTLPFTMQFFQNLFVDLEAVMTKVF